MKASFFFLVLIIVLIVSSCNNTNKPLVEPKIAKTVPKNYVLHTDTNFHQHQDTLYYQQQYFTGFSYALFDNGDTQLVKSYFNGLEEGLQQEWYSNKQLTEQRFYINGKKEGLQQGWWQNGKQKFIFTAADDQFIGEVKEWTVTGLLYRDFNYVNGREEGSQKMWWENGTIRANYVIKNGKKYGLLGLKICKNPYDSINKK